MKKFLIRFVTDIRTRQNIDIWILVVMGFGFAILGVLGVADSKLLNSCIVSLLGVVAISQLKSRDQVSAVTSSWERNRTNMLLTSFPDSYYDARGKATSNYFFAGTTMQRTLPTMQPDILRILSHGGCVRILLPNPENGSLLQMVAESRGGGNTASSIKNSIMHSLQKAKEIRDQAGGDIRIRTTDILPRVGINAIEIGYPSASIMIQMYEFQPRQGSEPGPIFLLTPADAMWFSHFNEEIERLWAAGADVMNN